MERIPHHPPPRTSSTEQRARRRYFQELAAVRQEVGESDHSSEDDNYPGMIAVNVSTSFVLISVGHFLTAYLLQ